MFAFHSWLVDVSFVAWLWIFLSLKERERESEFPADKLKNSIEY